MFFKEFKLKQTKHLKLQAIDIDEGMNAEVNFKILYEDGKVYNDTYQMSNLFLVDMETGQLRLNMLHADIERKLGEHRIVVEVCDFKLFILIF